MPVWLIQIVVSIALTLASTLIQQAFSAKEKAPPSGARTTMALGGDVTQSFLVGTTATAGKLEYINTHGDDGATPNAYLTQVISLSDLPVNAVTGLYVNTEAIETPEDDHFSHGWAVPLFNVSGRNHLFREFYPSGRTSASSYLTTKFGSDPDRPWDETMIGRGIAHVVMTARWNRDVWNGFPKYLFQVEGIRLYDVRKDSTAGGSGSHRVDDPDTWEFSDNPVVIIYNILLGIRYEGAWVWGMQFPVHQARMPYATWSAAMNACDEPVVLKGGGTEKRFRCGREIRLDELPLDVIEDILVGCTGRMSEFGGVYSIVIGDPGTAVGSFSDRDTIISDASTLSPFPPLDDVINSVVASYPSPEQAWAMKDAKPRYNDGYLEADDDFPQTGDLRLGTVFSGTQVQRVMKATLLDGRRFARHVVPLRPIYGRYRPLDVLAWTSSRNAYSAKLFLVTSVAIDPKGNVVLGLQEIDPSDHDWVPNTDEQDITYSPMTEIIPPSQEATGFQVFPDTIDDNDGQPRRPTFRVQYDGDLDDVRAVAFWVKLDGAADTDLIVSGEFPYGNPATNQDPKSTRINNVFPPNTDLETQFQYLPYSRRTTTPSSWLPVRTPNVVTDPSELPPIEVQMLGHELFNAHGLLTGDDPAALPTLIAKLFGKLDELAVAVIDANGTYKEVRKVLTAQHNGANASIVNAQKAIANETEARAEQITGVIADFTTTINGVVAATNAAVLGVQTAVANEASARATAINETVATFNAAIGDIDTTIADGYLEIDSVADAGSGTARITAKARARAGDAVAQAGWMIKAQANFAGGTIQQFGVLGTLYVFRSEIDNGIPVFSVDGSGNVHAYSLTFDSLLRSSATSGGVPLIYLDGNTGFFSFGA